MTPPTGLAAVGQAQTVTTTLAAPQGRPLVGVPVSFQIVSGPNAGVGGTTEPADGRTDAAGQVRFTYAGAGDAGTDVIVASAAVPEGPALTAPAVAAVWTTPVVPPPILPVPPIVTDFVREGVHRQPTRLVLTFSAPMAPATAEGLTHYILTPLSLYSVPAHHGRPIPLRSAAYDPATRTVTLRPARLLPLRRAFRLTATGLLGAGGVPLDGDFDGVPGGAYVHDFGRGVGPRLVEHLAPRLRQFAGQHPGSEVLSNGPVPSGAVLRAAAGPRPGHRHR